MAEPAPFILDVGAGFCRAGTASLDEPSYFKHSMVSKAASGAACAATVTAVQPSMDYYSPVSTEEGLITDWDGIEVLLRDALAQSSSSPSSSASSDAESALSGAALLLVESLYASKAEREKWCTLLFETYGCSGVYMARSGVLTLYANARVTGVAVDCGYGGCTLTPVQEGFPLMMGARRVQPGGRALDERIDAQLAAVNGQAYFHAFHLYSGCLSASPLQPSAAAFARAALSSRIRDACGRVHADQAAEKEALADSSTFKLPDGTVLHVGDNRHRCYASMFGSPFVPEGVPSLPPSALQDSVVAAVMACDAEIRQDLFSNIVLSGGVSTAEGFPERLATELDSVMPPGLKPRLAYAAPQERLHGAWIGGSILASLDAFPDMLFSKEDYAEKGAAGVHKSI